MKYRLILALMILALAPLVSAVSFDGQIPAPTEADLNANPACTVDNAWAIVNERCNGAVLEYDQCIPGIVTSDWEQRSINCEVKYGNGFICQNAECKSSGVLTGVWYYLPPVLVVLIVLLLAYLAYRKWVLKK